MNIRFAVYSSIASLLIAAGSLSGQITVPIDTTTMIPDPETRVITQTGTTSATGTDFRRFTFERLDTVAGGNFAGLDLLGVRVTISNSLTGNFSVTVINNDPSDAYGGPAGDFARTNFNLPTFTFGAGTTDDNTFIPITAGDFTAASPVTLIDLEGVNLSPGGGSVSASGIAVPTVTRVSNVLQGLWRDYDGTGTFNFDVRVAFGLETVVSGQNLAASQSTGDSQFTATVEYFVIPEPGTYAAIFGVFALGFIGIRRRLNRR
ncbi:MAG: PEP-CTERM sorting domain-containing protein [Opitutales bacterium]|nr:PEP-CTERM sorting domain-containing protein [Opitutales bacterium]